MLMRRRNIKSLSLIAIACVAIYLIVSSRYHKYQIDGVISNTKPENVWEFVADFSKMRVLNPTILDFKIISDGGNTHDWRYTVVYRERLSHWPYWLNTAKADYIITKSMPGVVPESFNIESRHETCFFQGTYCLRAESDFKFSQRGMDTYCIETIQYQCPPFLSGACHRELEYQRKAVMHNLTTIFSKKQRNQ